MNAASPESKELLRELKRVADLPLGAAVAKPAGLYRSEEIHRLERERIFAHEWLCAGRTAEIPDPGDYLTFSILEQPIFVIRGDDGAVRSFSNVCLHRMMPLLEGRGTIRRAVCPYHAWSYDLQGRLVGAAYMQRSDGFARQGQCLPEIRTEIWNGWIYVTLDPAAPALAPRLAPLQALVDRYGMTEYVPVIHQDHLWQTNWKLLNENFMEGYHGPIVHRRTVGARVDVEDVQFDNQIHEAFAYQLFTKEEGSAYGIAHPDNRRLEGRWRRTAVLPTVYPSHMYSLSPDYLWYLSLRPEGPGQVHVRIGVALAPEVHAAQADLPAFVETMTGFFDQVNGEDRAIVEGLYRGAAAPLARGGQLSWLEREIHEFTGYLARRLVV
jgi:phenylpropionate dioxygenase-like ring-hydroxylating dioxygenase large terminal subunit